MKKLFLFGAVVALGIVSCEMPKEGCTNPDAINFDSVAETDDGSCKMPEKTLEGTWLSESSILMGQTIPIDGYLKFNNCDTDSLCTGEDYDGTNETKGLFTYELSEDEATLTIVDTDEAGGSWNGDWTVEKYTETELEISKEVILIGKTTFKFNKE